MFEKTRKKMRVGFWILTLVTALIIGFVCGFNDVSDRTYHIVLVVYAVVMVGIWFAWNFAYTASFSKEVNGLVSILYDDEDPDRYLMELDRCLGDVKSKGFRTVYVINSAVAYCDKGDYQKAKELLAGIKSWKRYGITRLVYEMDVAMVAMHLGDGETALRIWNENKPEFIKLSGAKNIGATVAAIGVFAAICEGQTAAARRALEAAKEAWTKPRNQRAFAFLEDILVSMEESESAEPADEAPERDVQEAENE